MDRKVTQLGLELDCGGVGNEFAALGSVGLGHDADNFDVGRFIERGEAGAGELRCSHENNTHRLGHGGEAGLSLEIGEHCEHIAQDAYRCLGRVDRVNEVVAIMLEHRSGLGLVHFEPVANGVEVGVVEPVFAQCPGLKPLDHDVEILAEKIQYTDDIELVVEELSLSGIAGDSVEQQCVGLGIEDSIADTVLDVVMPEFDGGLVGDKLPLAGVVEEGLAKWVLYLQIAEEITAGDVQIGGDATKDFPLCALAGTG